MPPRNPEIHQCRVCHLFHSLKYCSRFLAMTAASRRRAVRRHNYCYNCLARSHTTPNCTSVDTCIRCGRQHHTLLHMPSLFRHRNNENRTRVQRENRIKKSHPSHRHRQEPTETAKPRKQQYDRNQPETSPKTPTTKLTRDLNANASNAKLILQGALRVLEHLVKKI